MPAIRHDDILLRLVKDVSYIRSILNRVTVNLPLYDLANENTPTQLTGDQDNYNIGNYDLLRLSSSVAVSITGMRPGVKGRFLRIFNVGSYPITLEHQDAGSSAANRFKFSNGRAATIPASSNIVVYYDSTVERWIGGDTLSSGALWASTFNNNAQATVNNTLFKVDPGTVLSDQYGLYDDPNNQYVIPFDGFFRVTLWVLWDSLGPGATLHYISVYINGGVQRANTVPDVASQIVEHEVSYENYLDKGDTVEFYVRQITGAGLNVIGVRTSIAKIA